MVYWDDLGFNTAYTVDSEPEYPADGNWAIPEVRLGADSGSLRGGPLAVISPHDGQAWLLSASVVDWGALYGSPDGHKVCFFDQFYRLVEIDVREPSRRRTIHDHPIRVYSSRQYQLLLVTDESSLEAFDAEGRRWRSEPLVMDDLKVVGFHGSRILCRGRTSQGGHTELALDASSGAIVEGGATLRGIRGPGDGVGSYLRPDIPPYAG